MATGEPDTQPHQVISSFSGKYRFLSNFYPCIVEYEGFLYPSSEHAYMAAKTVDEELKKEFQIPTNLTPNEAKKLGRKLDLRPDWEEVKDKIMFDVLCQKFRDDDLWEKLQDTGDAILIEGNTWGDRYWGQCPVGNGKNRLGITLMSIRDNTMWAFM